MSRYTSSDAERNYACRIREFIYRGHRCLTLENEKIRVFIAADKGADILEFLWKPLDLDVLWHAPQGLRAAGPALQSSPLPGGDFREHFAGGWYEMLPNGPVPSAHKDAAWGFHGESTLLPWRSRIEKDEPKEIAVVLETRLLRMPLHVQKTIRLRSGSGTLRIEESIRNESPEEVKFLWGQHPTVGWPFLEEGCRIVLPPCIAKTGAEQPSDARLQPNQVASWPQLQSRDGSAIDVSALPAPQIRSHDFLRLEQLQDGWFAIVNPHRKLGWALRWDVKLFPVLGFWQLFRGGSGYPWYGRHYLAALEPLNELLSLSEAVERGTAFCLGGLDSVETVWEATAFSSPLDVKGVLPGGNIV
jgi:hypothetical protein